MIVTIPLNNEPFHNDSEWTNWQTFFKSFETNNLPYLRHQLLEDPTFRRRIFHFLSAAQRYEHQLRKHLESLAATTKPLAQTTPEPEGESALRLTLQIYPPEHPNFGQIFGNWDQFKTAMLEEHRSLENFVHQLQFSLEVRDEVLQFLQDATHFENTISRAWGEHPTKDID